MRGSRILATALLLLTSFALDRDCFAGKAPPAPQLVAVARVSLQGGSCSGFVAIDLSGRVLVSQCYAPGFLVAAQLPGTPVCINSFDYGPNELYIGLTNGDIYGLSDTRAPLPWNFIYSGNALTLASARSGELENPGDLSAADHRVFPNPTPGVSRIEFVAPGAGPVMVRIFDVTGRLVRRLDDESQTEGRRTVLWDGRGDSGQAVATGTYFAAISFADGSSERRKITVAR
jgi:hypothetical protein